MSLDEFAVKHGTDKGSSHPKLTPKRYTEVYEALFGGIVVHRLLELGVAHGASIRMWAEWLPEATIVGVDRRLPLGTFPDNVRLYRGRQEDRDLLESVTRAFGPWDVVVDDGSHRAFDQLASFGTLWPHVRSGGYYAVEDLHAEEACTVNDLEALAGQDAAAVVVSAGRLAVVRKR